MPSKSLFSGRDSKPLRVAIAHDFLFTFGGAERLLKEVLAVFPEAPVYTLLVNERVIAAHFPNTVIHTSPLQRSPFKRWPALLAFACPKAVESFRFFDYDVVLSISGAFSHGILTDEHTRHICYCQTPMRYAWDYHAQYPIDRHIPKGLIRFVYESMMTRMRLWDTLSVNRVDTWLGNSRNVTSRITKYYRKPATVLYPPVPTPIQAGAARPLEEPYMLTISRLSTYKRIDLMIEAARKTGTRLIVIGEGHAQAELEQQAKGAPVTFLGHLSDTDAATWRSYASLFLFAANDDFGLTPVEAHHAGIPTVAVAYGGALETVIPGVNGILASEPTPESFTHAVQEALTTTWDTEAIKKTAQRFSRETFQKQLREVVYE